jgi:histidinol dehydrogenase
MIVAKLDANGEGARRDVYAARSRRSGGLSIGIDLFPDGKHCNFDCPYCEVFPGRSAPPFSVDLLEANLRGVYEGAIRAGERPVDLCFSGSGEPTLSPLFGAALDVAARFASGDGLALRVISNGTLFERWAAGLSAHPEVELWAKLDGGDEARFRAMTGSAFALESHLARIAQAAARHRVIVQTMLCFLDGVGPTEGDAHALAASIATVAGRAPLAGIHLYTKSRPSPRDGTSPLPDATLAAAARAIVGSLASALKGGLPPTRVFGSAGELFL